jgi:hypothetical protein
MKKIKIDDWDLVEAADVWFNGDGDLAQNWLDIFSDEPADLDDKLYVSMANEFLTNNDLGWMVINKLSQNEDGEIMWEILVN